MLVCFSSITNNHYFGSITNNRFKISSSKCKKPSHIDNQRERKNGKRERALAAYLKQILKKLNNKQINWQ